MLSSWVRSYADPEEYQSAFIGAKVEIIPTRSGPFTAKATHVELNRLWVARAEENAPRVKHAAQTPGRVLVSFLTHPGPELVSGGVAIPPAGLVRHSRAHPYHECSTGPTRWGAVSLPLEDIASAGLTLGGRDLS